jgi:hypothetical protein
MTIFETPTKDSARSYEKHLGVNTNGNLRFNIDKLLSTLIQSGSSKR